MEDGHKGPEQRPGARDPPSPVTVPHQGCANDEAHYITTHEIQLCEADQEPDYPAFGLAPATWSEPVDSAPCSFLEYASFDSQGGTPTDEEDCSYYLSTASDPNPTDSLGSTELVSSSSSRSSSQSSTRSRQDEATPGVSTGQILLSIQTAAKAINEPGPIQSSAPASDAGHDPAMSLTTAPGSRALQRHPHPASDAHRLVALPARLQARSGVHADISSGASSAVSELDDADKEVRSLTSRAFRSLAYPYFEAINFSSSESTTSLSDQNLGINSWSTYLDWKGGSFLSQKAEKTLHQHTSSTANFGLKKLGKDAGKEQQVYVQANKSETKAFELVVSEVGKGANPASSKRIKSGSRVVTLTETLNFSTDHAPGSACTDGVTETLPKDRAAPSLEVAKQSSSALVEAMDGTHKSKYASSLLKNIISKKMQLEQEFKMERGELSDTSHRAAPKEGEGTKDKGLQRQNSKFSEASSDFTLVSTEDLGEFFSATPKEATSLDKRMSPFETHREETICEMKKTASETMKGIFLRSQNSAFRSWKEKEIEKMEKKIEENVAKARRIKIPLERDWRAELGEISNVQATKMSRLYVPGIQHTPKEKQVEKQATKYSVSTYAHQTCFSRNENELKSEKLQILEASVSRLTPRVTPKPQEIKLKLGLSAENKDSPFNIAKLLTPNSAASLTKAAEDLRSQVPCRAEVLEKMPQFLVRDVREAKSKVPGAIHQVRDVRKLLKSSYSQDPGEGRASVLSDHSATDPKARLAPRISSSLSPIVITCQAVKSKEESEKGSPQDTEMGPETVLVHRASGRLPVATIAPSKTAPTMPVVKIVSKASKWKQEKPKEPEGKPEPKSPQSQVALQKLTAAVKTMEQLYVFDKEWKRKEEPQQLKGSHVLSMIAGHGAPEEAKPVAEIPRKAPEPLGRRHSHPGAESSPGKPPENKAPPRTFQVSKFTEAKKQEETKPSSRAGNVNVFTVSAAPARSKQQSMEASLNTKNTRPQPPSTLKIPGVAIEEPKKTDVQPPSLVRKASADFENYLTIPVKAATEAKPPVSIRDPPTNTRDPGTAALENTGTATRDPGTAVREKIGTASQENIGTAAQEKIGTATRNPGKAARENTGNTKEVAPNPYSSASTREAASVIRDSATFCTLPPFSTKTQDSSPKSPIKAPRDWNSKVREGVQPTRAASAGSEPQTPDSVPPAAIYHHPLPPMAMAMPSAQGPIYYSPPLTSATPAEMYPQTQRKMLVDLATGQYYLVDTPVQPIKRRLFDPETGQYVDVPVPPPPVTPVPLPMPQLALSPGAYGPAYMFYPGFLPTAPTAVLPPNHLQTQLSTPVSEHSYEMPVVDVSHPVDMGMADSPYYLATGSATANPAIAQATSIRRGSLGCPDGKQVISMLSQPGPRIVAPPSFDGTTMRFVVEHR
ncbi:uncharacterized protein C4orf54-like [Dendrobates tinctorius]|uniref:uncharacterized protein C4orf54-like n=1 Tax=Dendrobates tinctorius TaxID=92724 RepID=UPI003CCA506F